ncbi:MAG: glycosyltransferase family 9 protein [bacterium]|nr:glycosyltransferase family 9 protein [bacterium]
MIKTDCRHYVGAKPCAPHKRTGVTCETCVNDYDPITQRILIIKLGAMGDVLRTAAILRQLSGTGAEITWITKSNAVGLLENGLVDRVVPYGSPEMLPIIMWEEFDVVYSLDNDYDGAVLGSMAEAAVHFGYGVNESGKIIPFNGAADAWLHVSINDDLKKINKRTYQSVLFEICELEFDETRDTIPVLSDLTSPYADALLAHCAHTDSITAVMVGAGPRWPEKSLSMGKLRDLLDGLHKRGDTILLISGPEEAARMAEVATWGIPTINTDGAQSVKDTFAILNRCDRVVTGDTLVMHMAVALEKPTFTYVGPTSAAELAEYGVMTKLVPEGLDCLCCYNTKCPFPEAERCNNVVDLSPIFT